MSRGIDYAGPGSTVNRDPVTGIRYGIIPLHALGEFACDSFEPEYDASCPKCGDELPDDMTEEDHTDEHGKSWWGFKCPACGHVFPSEHAYGDEPSRTVLKDGEYEGMLDSSGDAWCFKSPYYTRAAFCSPCAPGACYLASPCDDGERAYCFGPDWFDDDNPAPYPIWRVDNDEQVTVGELARGAGKPEVE